MYPIIFIYSASAFPSMSHNICAYYVFICLLSLCHLHFSVTIRCFMNAGKTSVSVIIIFSVHWQSLHSYISYVLRTKLVDIVHFLNELIEYIALYIQKFHQVFHGANGNGVSLSSLLFIWVPPTLCWGAQMQLPVQNLRDSVNLRFLASTIKKENYAIS